MKSISYQFFFAKYSILPFSLFILLTNYNINLYGQNNLKKTISVIVIDAGHGGKDPGAHGFKSTEKNITLNIALKLGNYIKKYLPDVKVIYTRQTDVFVPLYERAQIANKNQADLFISIHVNSNHNQKPYGTETYAMGLAKTIENLEVARKENAVILEEDNYSAKYDGYDPNSSESFIIFSLLQNTYMEQSLNFATYVQSQFKNSAQRTDRGVKQAGFLVLWKTAMPSVLVETGFISNPEEEQFLDSDEGVDQLASAIFRAFKNYKLDIENRSLTVSSPFNDTVIHEKQSAVKDSSPITSVSIVPVDTSITDSTIEFLVQISSSKKSIHVNSKFFKGIENIEEIKTEDSFKYVVGRTNSYTTVLSTCKNLKKTFPDAFIIAVRNSKIIPVKEALKEIKN